MRVERFTALGIEHPELRSVRLTAGERATLRKASAILAELRELRDDADDDLTTDIALAAHVCDEIAGYTTIRM